MSSDLGRVLVVDDNENNRDILARRLARKGYDVILADSAYGLLDRIRNEAVDLVLLDVEMPGLTGLDALVAIRQAYSAVRLPVIMVTARNQSDDIVTALELGANDYLTKPIDFPVALARVRTHLSHMRAEEALRASEERYALAARGANDGLWDWNLRDRTIYFSARWKSMLGFHEGEIGNRPEEWFDRIHESDREKVARGVAHHLAGRTPHFEVEARMLHKDGVFRWMLTRGLMVSDETGRPLRMAGSQTDITEGKVADPMTGLWHHRTGPVEPPLRLSDVAYASDGSMTYPRHTTTAPVSVLREHLDEGRAIMAAASPPDWSDTAHLGADFDDLRWFALPACSLD